MIEAVVYLGLGPFGGGKTDSLLDSESVIEAGLQLARTDYRAFLRAAITVANPQASEEEVGSGSTRRSPTAPRRWRCHTSRSGPPGTRSAARAPPWATGSGSFTTRTQLVPTAALDRAQELLPEAHIVEAEDGPISRPDIAAGVVRKITAPLRAS